MKETTNHKLRYPEPGDADLLCAAYQHLAEDADRELDKIAPKQISGIAKKQLLIANASGVVTAVTASGDVTNDESGVFTIANGAVTDAKTATANKDGAAGTASMRTLGEGSKQATAGNDPRLSDERVPKKESTTEEKLADGATTSRKLKPTIGIVSSTADLTLTGSFQDIPGTELKITPAVASKLKITAFFDLEGNATCQGALNLDGVDQTNVAHMGPTAETFERHTVGQVWLLSLTAAAHTIKMRAKGTGTAHHPDTQMLYELVAS